MICTIHTYVYSMHESNNSFRRCQLRMFKRASNSTAPRSIHTEITRTHKDSRRHRMTSHHAANDPWQVGDSKCKLGAKALRYASTCGKRLKLALAVTGSLASV